jgi:hypothetical protein
MYRRRIDIFISQLVSKQYKSIYEVTSKPPLFSSFLSLPPQSVFVLCLLCFRGSFVLQVMRHYYRLFREIRKVKRFFQWYLAIFFLTFILFGVSFLLSSFELVLFFNSS